MARKATDYIVVHAADTYPDMDIGKAEIDRWHRRRGWLGIGYHLVIRRDGTVETGRPLMDPGAHVRGYNHKSVGVCMVGGKSRENDGPEDNFTDAQHEALHAVIEYLYHHFPLAKVVGHRELNGHKACPCFDVFDWLAPRVFRPRAALPGVE